MSVFCMLFSGLMVYELVSPFQLLAVTAPHGQAQAMTIRENDMTDNAVSPISAYSEIIERPLFRQDRRPYIPPPPISVDRQENPRKILLSAVVISEDQRFVLVYTDANEKLKKLRPGQTFEGWTLERLEADSITLKKDARYKQVKLTVKPAQDDNREANAAIAPENN